MLSSNYPEYIEVDEHKYKLNTDFRVALRCFEVIEDTNIDDYERTLAIVYLLLGEIPFNKLEKILPLLERYLSCDMEPEENRKPDMDLLFDEKYIVASFMSDYQLDLSKVKDLHWWQFITLIGGLTNDCILNRVREIRTSDLNDFKGKARHKLSEAKKALALPVRQPVKSREEIEAMERFNALFPEDNSQ